MHSHTPRSTTASREWIPLSRSIAFLVGKPALFGWSLLLVLITVILTWVGFQLTTGIIDNLTGNFFADQPVHETLLGWLKFTGWLIGKYLFLLVSRIVSFFLAFLLAYSLSTPFYSLLSTATEKIYCGDTFEGDPGFTLAGILRDLIEGLKIALFGIVLTVIALAIGFVPLIGQVAVFVLYSMYSTLMFIDYPMSRRRWSLGRKVSWINYHRATSFRIGILPAAVSMVPFLNMFLMAFIFPLFTVHATLNFIALENRAATRSSAN